MATQNPIKVVSKKTRITGELILEGEELSTSTSVRPSVEMPKSVSLSHTELLILSAGLNTTDLELTVLHQAMDLQV